jgi:predicted ATPase
MFVAREQQIDRLDEFLDLALAGQGQVCFVTGEAGTGKTALVSEFVRLALRTHQDLVATLGQSDSQTGAGDPYLPFREMLEQLTGDVEAGLARGTISEENAGRLKRFLRFSGEALTQVGPDLVGVFLPGAGVALRAGSFVAEKAGWLDKLQSLTKRAEEDAPASGAGIDQSNIYEQYTNLLRALAAKSPLVLVLDDLQWADAASLGLLFRLGRRIRESRILIVGTFRPGEVALGRGGERHPLDKVLAEFKRYFGEIEIDLEQIEGAEQLAFVNTLLDAEPNTYDSQFRQALLSHTGGHPLFTVELLRDMKERDDITKDAEGRWAVEKAMDWSDLPTRVEGVIEERLARLADELRRVLDVASVEGESFTAEVVAQISSLEVRDCIRRLSGELAKQHRLVSASEIRRLGERRLSLYQFEHNLIRTYIYGSLDEVERPLLHEDVGRELELLYGDQVDEVALQLAWHFAEAKLEGPAAGHMLRAARQAAGRFAHQEAANHFGRALEMAALAEAEGEGLPTGWETWEEFELACLEGLGEAFRHQGQHDRALEQYQAALELARSDSEATPARRASLCRRLANVYETQGRFDEAWEWLQKGLEELAGEQVIEAARIYIWGGLILQRKGQPQEAMEWCQRGIAIAEQLEVQHEQALGHNLAGLIQRVLGENELALEAHKQSLATYEAEGYIPGVERASSNLGVVYQTLENWAQATECFERSRELSERIGEVFRLAAAYINLGEVHRLQGHLDQAMDWYGQGQTLAKNHGMSQVQGIALMNMGAVQQTLGNLIAAQDHLEASLTIFQGIEFRQFFPEVFRHLAEVQLAGGQRDEALELANQALRWAGELNQRREEKLAHELMEQIEAGSAPQRSQ